MNAAAMRNEMFHVEGSLSFHVAITVTRTDSEMSAPAMAVATMARIQRLRPNVSGTTATDAIWREVLARRVKKIVTISGQ
jgi:hypothetical protein